MSSIYIETNDVKKDFMKSIDNALTLFDEAIKICEKSTFTSNIKSGLLSQKSKCVKVRNWVESSCNLYDEFSDIESDIINKSEVPEVLPRDNIINANY